MVEAHPGRVLYLDIAGIARVAAAVPAGITVQAFLVAFSGGHADPVSKTGNRCEVEQAQQQIFRIVAAATDKAQHRLFGIMAVYPLEAFAVEVGLVQGGFVPVQPVQVGDQFVYALMVGKLHEWPVQCGLGIPFGPLAELAAHEQQLLARVGILVGIQQPQVGETLPHIARHLVQHASFQMHHLIVGEGQHEVFSPQIELAEGQLVMVVLAVDGIRFHVGQGVVHPAHVPLHGKAQATHVRRAGYHGPGGGLFRDGDDTRKIAVDNLVHFPQEGDGLQVFATAKFIGCPVAIFPGVVQVEHGCHCIHTQAVDMEFLDPVQCVGDEEVAHFVAAEIEYQGAPVAVLALPRVGMFVQGLAGKARQGEFVLGEVGRYPVQEYADVLLVAGIDEMTQVVWTAEAGGGGIITGDLVTPGFIQRVLHDRQQFDMRVAQLLDIGYQFFCHFQPGIETAVFMLTPGTGMQFVDGDRASLPVPVVAVFDPAVVFPVIVVGRGDQRCGVRAHGHALGIGICFGDQMAIMAEQLILVAVAGMQAGNEQFPDAGMAAVAHGVAQAVPAVEVADDADALHMGRPDREQAAGNAVDLLEPGAQETPGMVMLAFVEQMQVPVGKLGIEAVGGDRLVPAPVMFFLPTQFVVQRQLLMLCFIQPDDEQIGSFHPVHGTDTQQFHLLGIGHEGADDPAFVQGMSAEVVERVVMTALLQSFQMIHDDVFRLLRMI